jgi:hypothetical protein
VIEGERAIIRIELNEKTDTMKHSDNLIWLDLEMTGLDPDRDSVIEIATLVTDKELNILAEGPVFAIHHPLHRLEAMDDWNRNQHQKSGLWQRVVDSTSNMQAAEQGTLAFLRELTLPGKSPLCGNTIDDQGTGPTLGPGCQRCRQEGIRAHRAVGHPRLRRRAEALPREHGCARQLIRFGSLAKVKRRGGGQIGTSSAKDCRPTRAALWLSVRI